MTCQRGLHSIVVLQQRIMAKALQDGLVLCCIQPLVIAPDDLTAIQSRQVCPPKGYRWPERVAARPTDQGAPSSSRSWSDRAVAGVLLGHALST
jgi:hypothetical protein